MAIHKLNPAKVKNVGPGTYEDGGGLRLVVSKTGAKKWVLRITVKGQKGRKEMGLGGYPTVSLARARINAAAARELARQGINPITARKLQPTETPTFTTCAARYIRAHRRAWANPKHQRQWVRTLKTYARPIIGEMLVDQISTEDILKILQPIWTTKTETASRVQGRLENVFDFAIAHGRKDAFNPARWKGHLDKMLPKPSRVKKVVHHPAMPFAEVPDFLTKLAESKSISAKALAFLILTATRTGEVLGATWDEIDIENAVWTIPAERMKAKREHKVPLTGRVIQILNSLHRFADTPYIFPGLKKGKPMSNMALLKLMRDMGYGTANTHGNYVPHGFRSSFRDWAGETTNHPSDVVEMALAHTIKNKVEAAYRRGDLFAKRIRLMEDWTTFLTSKKRHPTVIPFYSEKSG
ncbi:MAG: tyrosine-type recombinase/integrase [Gammaproteobacteria bacterium]|nr:tyrosine-type recombinase/integrase [Gammaproteobacteria bacterium]